ncbi:hypothetical protein ACOTB7_24235 [Achromobacter xylosoxidans]
MTETFDLSFSFKGARDYVQGPDMVEAAMQALTRHFSAPLSQIDFQMHRMTGSNLRLVITDCQPAAAPTEAVASVTFITPDKHWYGYLHETGVAPTEHVPYDESALFEACEFTLSEHHTRVDLASAQGCTPLEAIVSMTKAMHLRAFPQTTGKWVFCRWSSPDWQEQPNMGAIRVELTRAMGARLTRSSVTVADVPFGTVYFSARSTS